MADLALSATRTLLVALQSNVLNEVSSMRHYKAQLEELKKTVSTIQKVLLDADSHPQLSAQQQEYVGKLKDAVYDADDLFDEFLTLAYLNKGSQGAFQKVSDFFSSKNSLIAYNTSKEVKKIRENLESIADNLKRFGLAIDHKPIRERREETCFYVYKPAIIGRENDVKKVVDRLLGAPDTDVDFLTIVGFGGLGKTTVAQLVFDDERVKKEFPKRLWVCVSDQNGHQFDVKDIFLKVLDAADYKFDASSSKEGAFNLFQKALGEEKCLLVLDDVWNENLLEWNKLRDYLMLFGRGSRILATTRSMHTARVIGGGDTRTYDLKGLSVEDSSNLFNLTAFGDEGNIKVPRHPDLVKISEKILKKCSNVPLAIKVAGSLLYGQEMGKWREFEKSGLRDLSLGGDNIIPILKLSYDNLEPSLKSCFSYCAVFPKDFEIEKEMLISLWMAQGYIEPLYDGQSLEDAAEDHFSILLQRGFFKDVRMDNYGDVMACKVHDLMHYIAQEVAGRETCVASRFRSNSDYQKVRHLFEDRQIFEDDIFMECKIRSYLQFNHSNFGPTMLEPLVANWKCLRSLSINHVSIEELPSSVGKLLHLRYIKLSFIDKLKKLPNTITNLHNLQTLILNFCKLLRKLPKDLSKLVHLRHLNISGCGLLKELPKDLSKLVHLRHFDISHCGLLKELPKDLSKLVHLRHFDISHCGLLKELPKDLSKSVHLRHFDISHCGLLKELPKDLSKLVHLRHFDISHCGLLKELPKDLSKLVHLRHFDISHCGLLKELPKDLNKLVHLRHFDISHCGLLKELPKDLNKLVHLRHFDISHCGLLKELPNDLSKLVNLRHLNISGCINLRKFPNDFHELVNLRHLDTTYCHRLTYMPLGIGKLTSLTRLNEFNVANGISCGQLKDLKGLVNLRGELSIKIPEDLMKEYEGESGYLVGMEQLMSVTILFFGGRHDDEERVERDETLISKLQPPANLREFVLWNYMGRSISRWGDNLASFLPNLVIILLWNCKGLQHLPTISQLKHLRSLKLYDLYDLEYVEEDIWSGGGALSSRSLTFFPSLVELYMWGMRRVKGWFGRKGEELVADQHSYSFPSLTNLSIKRYPNLVAMPSCPALDELNLGGVNASLRLKASPHSEIKVREVYIDHVADLGALLPCHLTRLLIRDDEVENFSAAGEVFQAHNCFSLRHLYIKNCRKLRSLKGGGFQHLTNLESLSIEYCSKLKLNEEDDGDGIPWRSLHDSLLSLHLGYCGNEDFVVPRGVRCLSNLQELSIPYNQHMEANLEMISCLSSLKSLIIRGSPDLKSIPEGMRSLTSLRRLEIDSCSEKLKQRCRNPDGEDWPKIKHILELQFR